MCVPGSRGDKDSVLNILLVAQYVSKKGFISQYNTNTGIYVVTEGNIINQLTLVVQGSCEVVGGII